MVLGMIHHLPSQDGGVISSLGACHDHVGLTGQVGWDGALAVLERSELRSSLVDETAELRASRCLGALEDEALASGNGACARGKGDGGESLNVQVGALGARLDELRGNREDGTGSKLGVKGSWDGHSLGCDTDEGLMARLNSGDGGGSAENLGVLDKRSGSEVAVCMLVDAARLI